MITIEDRISRLQRQARELKAAQARAADCAETTFTASIDETIDINPLKDAPVVVIDAKNQNALVVAPFVHSDCSYEVATYIWYDGSPALLLRSARGTDVLDNDRAFIHLDVFANQEVKLNVQRYNFA